MIAETKPTYHNPNIHDNLDYAKKCFSELAMRACPLHLALKYKREIAQNSSVDGFRKIGVRLVEEICQ